MQEVPVKVTKYGDRKYRLMYVVVDDKRGQTRSTRKITRREAELREGRYKPASSITWESFRRLVAPPASELAPLR